MYGPFCCCSSIAVSGEGKSYHRIDKALDSGSRMCLCYPFFLMALRIRLQRGGAAHAPVYRVVVAEALARRDGRCVEYLGTYTPQARKPEDFLRMKLERVDYWLGVGAQPSETVRSLIKKARTGEGAISEMVESKAESASVPEAEATKMEAEGGPQPVPVAAEVTATEAPAEESAPAAEPVPETPAEEAAPAESDEAKTS